ncbi:MAG: type II secretion system protein [Lachnospiraceae bacterium]|nr:type II secretion system protein [Lachnospiraceae bacterium]
MTREKAMKDNRGAALLVIIVAMLFIGIIASIVMTAVQGNLRRQSTNVKSVNNFYSNEEAIDELKNGVRRYADDAIKAAYEEFLREYQFRYAPLSDENRTREFRKLFADKFKTVIEQAGFFSEATEPKGLYEGLLSAASGDTTVTCGTGGFIDASDVDNTGKIYIRNISVTKKSDDGSATHISTITTDFEINIVTPTVVVGLLSEVKADVAEFALIADKTVEISAPSTLVVGNIYGGGKKDGDQPSNYTGIGLRANYGSGGANLYSDRIISRTTLSIENGSKLFITGKRVYYGQSAGENMTDLWLKNIQYFNGDGGNLRINGNCYVADDLSVDEDNCSFTLDSGSTYYGYSNDMKSSEGNPGYSSSVVINGKNANLDFSKASKVWLAGRDFISVPYRWGYVLESEDGVQSDTKYLQGESVSFRALQASYMVPGECINVGHNPVSDAEHDSCTVDLSLSQANGGLNLSLYTDYSESRPTKGYKWVSVFYGGQKLWYCYLEFKNLKAASTYFEDYEKMFRDLIISRTTMTGDSTKVVFSRDGAAATQLNPEKVQSTGNIVYYDAVNGEYQTYLANLELSDVNLMKSELSRKYSCVSHTLDELMNGPEQDMTDTVAEMSKVTKNDAFLIKETDDMPVYFKVTGDPAGREAYMIVSNENVSVDGSNIKFISDSGNITETKEFPAKAGIILAKGDVHITTGTEFWGTVIAGGNIYLEGTNATVKAAAAYVRNVIQTNLAVKDYFTDGDAINGSSEGYNTSNLINMDYENWKKD